jgi:bifunctional DNase/RNase
LLKTVITELGGKVSSVIISDLIEDIFHARLVFDIDGRHVEIDSRPSDAIALAVRLKAPIFVAESVMEEAGVTVKEGADLDESHTAVHEQTNTADNLDVYRDFINNLDALDGFGKSD